MHIALQSRKYRNGRVSPLELPLRFRLGLPLRIAVPELRPAPELSELERRVVVATLRAGQRVHHKPNASTEEERTLDLGDPSVAEDSDVATADDAAARDHVEGWAPYLS